MKDGANGVTDRVDGVRDGADGCFGYISKLINCLENSMVIKCESRVLGVTGVKDVVV